MNIEKIYIVLLLFFSQILTSGCISENSNNYTVHLFVENCSMVQINVNISINLNSKNIFNQTVSSQEELWTYINDYQLSSGKHIIQANEFDTKTNYQKSITIEKEMTIVIQYQLMINGTGKFFLDSYEGNFEPY
ncbi:MAG: hypothetical protein JW939_06155 [Candidatus Thermoplasmatota archaeon]|nr:hypothetical protein [Candidatus Thermoplasmatota archaeon]